MDIYVDDQPYHSSVDDSRALAVLVDEVRQRAADDDHMIVAIRCDGNDITGDGFEERMAKPAGLYQRVDLYTGLPHDLVEDAMEQAGQLLEIGSEDRAKVVELLGAGKASEAIERLGKCMRVWHQVHEGIVNALAILELDADTLMVGDRKIVQLLETSRDRLTQIKEALQSRDFVLLSDTLQYEFDEVIDAWKAVIDAIRKRL